MSKTAYHNKSKSATVKFFSAEQVNYPGKMSPGKNFKKIALEESAWLTEIINFNILKQLGCDAWLIITNHTRGNKIK